MNKVRISIIVPIYNSEKYLKRCIDSLVNQSMKEIEIILVNDGSTDGSLKLIEDYAMKDSRIRIINKNNGGVSTARNAGIEIATGKYISFVDSDDWCEINMFEKMYEPAKEMELDFINIGYSMDNKKGISILKNPGNKYLVSTNLEEIAAALTELPLGYSVMKLYKSDLISKNKIRFKANIALGEDAIFVQDYVYHINSIAIIDSCSYHYVRCNNESLSTKYTNNISEFVETFWEKEDEINAKFPKYRELRAEKGLTKNINGTIFQIINNYKKGSPLNKKQRTNFIKDKMENNEIYIEIINFEANKFSDKIFVRLFQLRNPIIMDLVYSTRSTVIKILNILTGVEK